MQTTGWAQKEQLQGSPFQVGNHRLGQKPSSAPCLSCWTLAIGCLPLAEGPYSAQRAQGHWAGVLWPGPGRRFSVYHSRSTLNRPLHPTLVWNLMCGLFPDSSPEQGYRIKTKQNTPTQHFISKWPEDFVEGPAPYRIQ